MTPPREGFLARRIRGAVSLDESDHAHLEDLESNPVLSRQGEVLIRQGAPYTRIGILQAGWALSTKELPTGRRQVLDFLLPGAILGWQGAMFRAADSGVCARTDVLVSWTPADRVAEIVRSSPGLGCAFGWLAACDHAILAERLASLGQRPARERLGHLLLELWRRMSAIGLAGEAEVGLPLSQALLADAVGLSPVHVNRSLRRLAQEGLIRVRRQAITVLDVAGLAAAVGYDDGYLHEDGRAFGGVDSAPAERMPERPADYSAS